MKQAFTTTNWKRYLVPTNPFVKRFLNKNGDIVMWNVANAIHTAIKDKKEDIGIIVHENAPSVVIVNETEYMEVLNYCNTWFEEREQYEKCAKIQKFKSKIKKPRKKKREYIDNVNH